MAYRLEYTEIAIEHLRKLRPEKRAAAIDQLEERLADEPSVPARNRKLMDPDRKLYVAPWELRLGGLRVYYAVEEAAKKVVVVAVGVKERSKLFIGGKEVKS